MNAGVPCPLCCGSPLSRELSRPSDPCCLGHDSQGLDVSRNTFCWFTPLFYWSTSFSSFLRNGPWKVNVLRFCLSEKMSLVYPYIQLMAWKLFSFSIVKALLHGFLVSNSIGEKSECHLVPNFFYLLLKVFMIISLSLVLSDFTIIDLFFIQCSGHLVHIFLCLFK